MHQDRGLTAIIGLVFAFSLLWTIAILVPDSNDRAAQSQNQFQLVVNGTHFVLDTNVDQTDRPDGEEVQVIHYQTPRIQTRVSSISVATNLYLGSASIKL